MCSRCPPGGPWRPLVGGAYWVDAVICSDLVLMLNAGRFGDFDFIDQLALNDRDRWPFF